MREYTRACVKIINNKMNRNLEKIYAAGADVGKLEEEYVLDALRNGWYKDRYKYVEQFESAFATYHNRKYALMTPNCTSAIQMLLKALDVDEDDEVIVPECTWIASAVGIDHLRANTIFCDIDKDNWCIDPIRLEEKINSWTKAIIVVDLYGNMPNWDVLEHISKKYNIPIIEDAAEALGSTYNGRKAGEFGIASVFSFHNTKTITTGEGGMMLTDDKDLYEKCVKLRDLGRGPDTKPYFNDVIGYKFMPFNIQAALGLAQLHRIDELLKIKKDQFDFYSRELFRYITDIDYQLNNTRVGTTNGVWITTLVIGEQHFLDGLNKEILLDELNKMDIPARPFFYPLSSLPAYGYNDEEREYSMKNSPVAYDISARGISLPGAYNMTEEQQYYVCRKLKDVIIEGIIVPR